MARCGMACEAYLRLDLAFLNAGELGPLEADVQVRRMRKEFVRVAQNARACIHALEGLAGECLGCRRRNRILQADCRRRVGRARVLHSVEARSGGVDGWRGGERCGLGGIKRMIDSGRLWCGSLKHLELIVERVKCHCALRGGRSRLGNGPIATRVVVIETGGIGYEDSL